MNHATISHALVTDEADTSCSKVMRSLGFTLIELSIVLVIIGLIVGGILVGQDLIKAAQIRATVGQIEKYNTAVNTFQTKFNGMPGDLNATTASGFGLLTMAGTTGRGDGNGLIDGTVTSPSAWCQECGVFWVHLSQANLIDGSFSSTAAQLDAATPVAVPAASVSNIFPLAKIGRGNYIAAGSAGGLNYYLITGILSAVVTTGNIIANGNLTPIEAYNMDTKLDDGMPILGIVQAKGAATATSASSATMLTDGSSSAASASTTKCLVGDTVGTDPTDTYNRSLSSGGTSPNCSLRFRFN